MLWRSLDVGFFFFHTAWILFNLFGWIFRETRRWNLAAPVLTGLSWFGLGVCYGWGYCACTGWHWDVRRRLEYEDASYSYVHFLILKLTGIDIHPPLVDMAVVGGFFVSLIASLYVNLSLKSCNPCGKSAS